MPKFKDIFILFEIFRYLRKIYKEVENLADNEIENKIKTSSSSSQHKITEKRKDLYTVGICIVFAIIVTTKQYAGDPIGNKYLSK